MNFSFEQKIQAIEYLKEFISKEKLTLMEEKIASRTEFILPVLNDIFQYRNSAAIIRSAEGFGFQKMIAIENKHPFDVEERVVRGATKWVNLQHTTEDELSVVKKLKNQGYAIVSVSPEREAKNLNEYSLTKKVALIFGTEKAGVSEEVLHFSDETVKIPMRGFTESLNVSVAAGICLSEFRNKLEHSTLEWRLSESEKINTLFLWYVNSVKESKRILERYFNTSAREK